MLLDWFSPSAARYLKLPPLGDHLDALAERLVARRFPPSRIGRPIREAPVIEAVLLSHGVRDLG